MARMHNGKQLIVGMGQTGLSCARYCRAQGWPFDACDSRQQPPELEQWQAFTDSQLLLADWSALDMRQYQRILLSPGVALATPQIQAAIAAGVEVSSDVQVFADAVKKPFIAITGSNGKSTVTSLVAGMLQASGASARAVGNIGIPVLEALLEPDQPDWYVVELSSFQLETCHQLPSRAAVLLNLSPDHLDRYPDMAAYAAAKQRIFASANKAVVNLDDPASRPNSKLPCISFSLQQAGDITVVEQDGESWIQVCDKPLMSVSELGVSGQHNLSNVLAALALVVAADIDPWPSKDFLRQFAGLEHRCQVVADIAGVRYINDSKGTNIGSTKAAIEGLSGQGRLFWIGGGVGKEQDFSELAQTCQQYVYKSVLFGRDATLIAQQIKPLCDAQVVSTLDDALQSIVADLRPSDCVLFSPACASFDQYKNYSERGDAFVHAVRSLELTP